MLKLHFTAASDRGLVRKNNEDSAYAGPYLLVLADGMGGHAAGEVASQLMVEHLEHLNRDPEDNDMLALLGGAANDANASIANHIKDHPETEGMGTTLTAMMFNGTQFGVCHVGDSRGYRLRDGKLTQITKDDTFVQSLVDEGKLDPSDVSSHPQKSLILKAYTGRSVEPTLFMLDAKPGDRLLLCSDGLSDPVTASTIEDALQQGTVEEAAQRLIELALRSGGPDNVTMVIAEVVESDEAPAEPVAVGALAGDTPEPTHPDSAASRAAALERRPQVIEPHTNQSAGQPRETSAPARLVAEEETADEEPDRRRKSSRGTWIATTVVLAVLIAAIAGVGVWGKNYLDNNYYVTTAGANEEIQIERGADFSVFGKDLHETYQVACLGKDGALRLSNGSCDAGFNPLKVEDLPATERGVVHNLDSGSYDEVQGQLTRLADNALPVCRDKADDQEDKRDNGFRREPGVNCREVN